MSLLFLTGWLSIVDAAIETLIRGNPIKYSFSSISLIASASYSRWQSGTPGAHGVLREGFLNEGNTYRILLSQLTLLRKAPESTLSPPLLEPTLGPLRNSCSSLPRERRRCPPLTPSAGPARRPPPARGECRPRRWAARRAGRHHLALHSCLEATRANAMRSGGSGPIAWLLSASMPDGAPVFSPQSFGFRVSGVGWWHLSSLPTVISNIKRGLYTCCRLWARLSGVRTWYCCYYCVTVHLTSFPDLQRVKLSTLLCPVTELCSLQISPEKQWLVLKEEDRQHHLSHADFTLTFPGNWGNRPC